MARLVSTISVFGVGSISTEGYDKVEEFASEDEYGRVELVVNFEKDGKVVRRMYNPPCDIEYKD